MNYFKKYFRILLILPFILTTIIFPSKNTLSSPKFESVFNVLVINSYNLKSNWEQLIHDGLSQKLSLYNNINININTEFLDCKTQFSEEYIDSFINLLNIKYDNSIIDVILAVDDEAFNLARSNLFNKDSIFYHKPIVFIGVNSLINITPEESSYITGVIETEDNLRILNLITSLNNDVENIILLLDNAIFSKVVTDNIMSVKNLATKPLNITILQEDFIEDLIQKLPKNDNKSAMIIIGDYQYKNSNKLLSLTDTIRLIQNKTTIPVFSKIQPYIFAGAIGGVVDWGQYHGEVAAEFILRLLNSYTIVDLPAINNSLDLTVFNYDALYKYNINPLLLPTESLIINKGPFDFLLPTPLKILLWLSIISSIIGIFTLLFLHIRHLRRKKVKLLLFNKALEQEKFKNDFITTMSHEFRTPINIILSTSHLLDIKCDDDIVDKNYIKNKLQYITQNSNRLLKLTNNIIDITKLESGFMKPLFLTENIVEVIENTVLSTVDFAVERGLEIIFDTDEEEIFTAFDKSKIERCILNLISNAIKFTPEKGSIYVNVKKEDNNVVIIVRDTGIGILPEHLTHIFERFHQVNSSLNRTTEGSGLGLYIVKGLITLHNGTIFVDSLIGNGTTFTIKLPIVTLDKDNLTKPILYNDLESLVKLELSDLQD